VLYLNQSSQPSARRMTVSSAFFGRLPLYGITSNCTTTTCPLNCVDDKVNLRTSAHRPLPHPEKLKMFREYFSLATNKLTSRRHGLSYTLIGDSLRSDEQRGESVNINVMNEQSPIDSIQLNVKRRGEAAPPA